MGKGAGTACDRPALLLPDFGTRQTFTSGVIRGSDSAAEKDASTKELQELERQNELEGQRDKLTEQAAASVAGDKNDWES
jgi:hypothetical protein